MHFRAGLVLGLRFRCASALMPNRVYTLMNDKTVFILTLILRGVSERRFLGILHNRQVRGGSRILEGGGGGLVVGGGGERVGGGAVAPATGGKGGWPPPHFSPGPFFQRNSLRNM